ncbi:MAG: hypothetical protein RL669_762, partial [Pseudomonadota bacterium]
MAEGESQQGIGLSLLAGPSVPRAAARCGSGARADQTGGGTGSWRRACASSFMTAAEASRVR